MASISQLAVSCVVLCGACSGLSQVPKSQHHGTLHFRVVHPSSDELYEDTVQLDREQPVVLAGLRNNDEYARLSPGTHHVRITSRRTSYVLAQRQVRNPYG